MLDNIKSKYFYKNIFSHLTNKLKLDIIKYNKRLQKLIDIILINFGKYIVLEPNSIGKEYNFSNDIIIFEGEYLNGKRIGKGKEYNNDGIIIYEGEYLNGERNGKGKEYDHNGYLIFDGEYLKGKKWNGKGYDIHNNFINEIKDGKGYLKKYSIKDSHLEFEGEYLNGEINGKGKEYDNIGDIIYEGEYLNGKRWNGITYNKKDNKKYIIQNGKGFINEYNKEEKLSYEYNYLNGEKNGQVKIYYNNILKFEGEYKNGRKNGIGKEYNLFNNLIFEGEYKFDRKVKGKLYIKGTLEFEGEFLFNKKWNGKGYDENGNIIYELINGNGKVKEYYSNYDSLIFEGQYLNGRKNGKGKEYDTKGNLIFEGDYFNDKMWNGKLYDIKNNIICKLNNGKGQIKKYDLFTNQLKFEAEYLNGEINGKGKEYYKSDNVRFNCEYLNGKKNGKGKEYDYYNRLVFEGEYKNDRRNGIGKEYKFDHLIFEGEYTNGNRNGIGKEYYNDNIIFEGEYLNGEMWNGIIRRYVNDKSVVEFQLFNGNIINEDKII